VGTPDGDIFEKSPLLASVSRDRMRRGFRACGYEGIVFPGGEGLRNILGGRASLKTPVVPFVAQGLTNPTRIHEDVGLIPGLTQWVKDPLLL